MKQGTIDADIFNCCYPVCSITIYKNGCQLGRENKLQGEYGPAAGNAQRGTITRLSNASLSRLAFVAANTSARFLSMLTLTYGVNFPLDGRQVARDRNSFLTGLQRREGKVSYLWVLEFQKRGAPHFHILLSAKALDSKRAEIARIWSRTAERSDLAYSSLRARKSLWSRGAVARVHEHPGAWVNLRKEDAARRYVAKYAFKREQKDVPKEYADVGRFWGHSRDVAPTPDRVIDVASDDEARRFLAQMMNRPDLATWDILPRWTIRHQTDL